VTLLILALLLPFHSIVRKYPLKIKYSDGEIELVNGLNTKIITILAGSLILIWIPRFINQEAPAVQENSAKAGVSQASPNPLEAWPKKMGNYIVKTGKLAPNFPLSLDKFRSEKNINYWGDRFITNGSVRIFGTEGWQMIPDFPLTQNGCSRGVFMMRWRADNDMVRVATNIGYSVEYIDTPGQIGSSGYMFGTNCEQPMFKFVGTRNDNESTLSDIYYEINFWQAAP
jgi:hypothetical protein